jgi:putative NADH-flavin reductase
MRLLAFLCLVVIVVLQTTREVASFLPSHETVPQQRRQQHPVRGPAIHHHAPHQQQQEHLPISSSRLFASSGKEQQDKEGLAAANNKKKQNKKRRKKQFASSRTVHVPDELDDSSTSAGPSKEDLVRAVGERMRGQKKKQQQQQQGKKSDKNASSGGTSSLLDNLNPFKAGQKLRQTIDTALTDIVKSTQETDRKASIYYLDDDLLEKTGAAARGGSSTFSSMAAALRGEEDSLFANNNSDEDDCYIPEVLVVGATGTVGRLIVKRLQLDGRFRVRVLVRDLYTRTLNALGTGVTYCPGNLDDVDSLEYAVTDVDKIVFCADAPRPDEPDFQSKFRDYTHEMLQQQQQQQQQLQLKDNGVSLNMETGRMEQQQVQQQQQQQAENLLLDNTEWEQLDSILQVRAQLAEQVDCVGLGNLVRAYQNVRHSDFGTSQAAKRTLFKFERRPEDFNLFAIDEGDNDNDDNSSDSTKRSSSSSALEGSSSSKDMDYYGDMDDDDYDEYEDYDDDDDEYANTIEQRSDYSAVQAQVQWIRNKFGHGVFVGRIPRDSSSSSGNGGGSGGGGEASIITSRLRARDDPDCGIDLAAAFAGFVARVCSDGGTYEAFVRTRQYFENGIEYVCEFSTNTKQPRKNASRNKFTTVRLPFESFRPVQRRNRAAAADGNDEWIESPPPFQGKDVRNIGFRFRSSRNKAPLVLGGGAAAAARAAAELKLSSFYLALSYIKLYRSQPEPEFVYVSDARIPPQVKNNMVRHDSRRLLLSGTASNEGGGGSGPGGTTTTLLDESALRTATLDKGRTEEEIYFKYRGEDILKKSGLSYAIARVPGYNEIPSGEASTIELSSTLPPSSSSAAEALVSRDEVAQICVNALLDPSALNKSFYVSKKKGQATRADEDISAKFKALAADTVV